MTKMPQLHIHLPLDQVKFLADKKRVYGTRAAVVRAAIQQMMDKENNKGVKHGK